MGSPSLLLSLMTDDFSGAFHPPHDSHTNPDRAPADGSCSGTFYFKKKCLIRHMRGRQDLQAKQGDYVFTLNVVLLRLNIYIIRRVYSSVASFLALEMPFRFSLEDQRDESQVLKAGLGKHPQFLWPFLPPCRMFLICPPLLSRILCSTLIPIAPTSTVLVVLLILSMCALF